MGGGGGTDGPVSDVLDELGDTLLEVVVDELFVGVVVGDVEDGFAARFRW